MHWRWTCGFRAESVRTGVTVRGMTSRSDGRDAEHALVAALVLGHADPAELSGRLTTRDFFDPAAGLIFETVMTGAAGGRPVDPVSLAALLRAAEQLRGDGYPIRPLLDWLPTVSVPAHPQAWGALVVASSLTRQVEAAGVRLGQASDGYRDLVWGAGRVLAVAAAQRATVHQALVRWESLPGSWRHAVTSTLQATPAGVTAGVPGGLRPLRPVSRDEQLLEQELLAGLVAAPRLLEHIGWLQPRDFTDPACGQLYTALRQLHREGRPIDLVTVAATLPTTPDQRRVDEPAIGDAGSEPESAVLRVCRSLQPHRAFPATVPWLARQQLEGSLLRAADETGKDLVRIAASPVSVGGLGGPVLRAAVARLDDFTDEGRRLEAAQRTAPSRDDAGAEPSTVTRLRALDTVPSADGRDPGSGHLDRSAG